MTRRRALVLPSLLIAAAALTGCGGDEPGPAGTDTAGSAGSTTASPPASGSTSAAPVGGEVPPFPADARPDTAEASSDARVTVSDIRTGRHEGFDRVVFEVGGAGTPGWDVRYVDTPSSQGSGEPVEVAGEATLQVTLTGAGYPYDTGVDEWAGPDPLAGDGTQVVTEVAWDGTFEGTSVAFVGTEREAPFRVYVLEGPTRLVVEVADPS